MSQVFSIVRHGYSPEEVDSYILELQALINQRNREIKAYKAREEEISKIEADAYAKADAILEQANRTADGIMQKAHSYSGNIRHDSIQDLSDIAERTRALKVKLDQFRDAYDQIVQQYLIATRAQELSALYADLEAFMDQIGLKNEEEAVNISDIAAWNPRS